MRKFSRTMFLLSLIVIVVTISNTATVTATEECILCHESVTPETVDQWEQSRHSEVGVGCFDCHEASASDPSAFSHSLGLVTSVVSPNACAKCHATEVEEYSMSKHAWTTFIGPLKPWYQAMVAEGKDPLDMQTAIDSNPEEFIKGLVTPLFPDSGALENAGLLDDPEYNHENQVNGCETCHGTYVIAEDGEITDGWPNSGVGRVNPDGSLGSCASCHTRHVFSKAEARKPETCGQCHLGPDHPQMEIYEESKHGNIFFSSGESWDWDDDDWGVDDINAPTCATCHMSGFNGAVETTHDSGARLYWEMQPKKSVPQWDSAELVPLGQQSPDIEQAEAGRAEMKEVCTVCHVSSWVDPYFESFDNTISDYNMMYDYTLALLNEAYDEGLIDPSNPIDEVPEIQHYYIWHHSGRRWRMGAAMMAPDWTHWNGAVDALLGNLNSMENWITDARETKVLEAQLMTTETQLQQALLEIEDIASDTPVEIPDTGTELLMPSAIIGLGIIIAAVLLLQRDKL
jgi:hydroxylamine dehydrogenase